MRNRHRRETRPTAGEDKGRVGLAQGLGLGKSMKPNDLPSAMANRTVAMGMGIDRYYRHVLPRTWTMDLQQFRRRLRAHIARHGLYTKKPLLKGLLK